MTLTIYNVTDAPNVVNKSLANGVTISAQPVEPCDFLSPSFIIDKSGAITSGNYIVAGAPLNRHYFITDKSLITGNRVLVVCAVDVLTTYASGIKNSIGTVLRSESIGKPTMIPDSKLPVYTNQRIVDADKFPDTPFSAAFNNLAPYILTTIGGSTT